MQKKGMKISENEISITVIIPAFNRESTIWKCLESVEGQTYEAKEIIVVDDGSTDRTRDMIRAFPSDKIRLLCQEHKGAQAARNKGIQNAKGNYIAFLDSDDEWVDDKLEKQVSVLKRNPDAVVYSNCVVVNGSNSQIWKTPGKSGWAYKELLSQPGPTFPGMIVAKKALLDIGLLDEKVAAYQEWDTAICLAKKYEMIHMEEPLFYYYIHDGESISKNSASDIAGYEYVVNKHKKEIIRTTGYISLNRHYRLLIKKCIQYKSIKIYKYIWKYGWIDLLMKVRGIIE